MGFPFYRRISIQTTRSPEGVKKIFSDIFEERTQNEEIERLLKNDWKVTVGINSDRFYIRLKRNALPLSRRQAMGSILKGKILKTDRNGQTNLSITIRPGDDDIATLIFYFLFIMFFFVYSLINNSTPPLVISGIILPVSIILFLMEFRNHVKIYKRIMDGFWW